MKLREKVCILLSAAVLMQLLAGCHATDPTEISPGPEASARPSQSQKNDEPSASPDGSAEPSAEPTPEPDLWDPAHKLDIQFTPAKGLELPVAGATGYASIKLPLWGELPQEEEGKLATIYAPPEPSPTPEPTPEPTPAPTPEPTPAAAGADLAAFYEDVTNLNEFGFLQLADETLLDGIYPGLTGIETEQCLVYVCQMSINNGEFGLVQVKNSGDVAAVKAVFQARIDYMVGDGNGPGGAWYPGATDMWENYSRVVSNGNYVMMVIHENCDEIVSQFNELF